MLFRSLLVLGLGAALAAPAFSQGPAHQHGQRGSAPRQRSVPVEAALRHRDQLKLTERQVADLTALREEGVKARQQRFGEVMALSSRFRAGELTREEFRSQMHDRRDAAAPAARQQAERLQGILDETQRTALRDMMRADQRGMRRSADRMDRMGGRRGRP
ncbi:MAG TPA: hypothetical protein VF862_11305 [Gemmatimonadales bacterium]